MTTFERVKEISKKHGYSSLRTLAEDAGLSQNALYSWRKNEPSSKSAKAVADVLGVSVDYLLGNTDTPNVSNLSQHETEADFKNSLDKAIAYNGKPLSDHDKAVIMSFMATLKAEDD